MTKIRRRRSDLKTEAVSRATRPNTCKVQLNVIKDQTNEMLRVGLRKNSIEHHVGCIGYFDFHDAACGFDRRQKQRILFPRANLLFFLFVGFSRSIRAVVFQFATIFAVASVVPSLVQFVGNGSVHQQGVYWYGTFRRSFARSMPRRDWHNIILLQHCIITSDPLYSKERHGICR